MVVVVLVVMTVAEEKVWRFGFFFSLLWTASVGGAGGCGCGCGYG